MGRDSGSESVRETAARWRATPRCSSAPRPWSPHWASSFPHQAEANDGGLALVVIAAGAIALALALGRDRLASWAIELAVASGTVLIALSLVFNGERDGGAAGGDEVYYLWIALFSAYYFSRRALALQTAFIAVAYAAALYVIDPGPVAVSRWLTMVGLAVGAAVIVRLLSERNRQLVARSRPDGADRPAHRPGEPPRLRGAVRGGDREVRARRPAAVAAARRRRPPEGDQRPLGPPGRRHGPRPGRARRCGRSCAPATPPPASAETSSPSCSRAWTPPRREVVASRLGRARAGVGARADLRLGITFGVATLPDRRDARAERSPARRGHRALRGQAVPRRERPRRRVDRADPTTLSEAMPAPQPRQPSVRRPIRGHRGRHRQHAAGGAQAPVAPSRASASTRSSSPTTRPAR